MRRRRAQARAPGRPPACRAGTCVGALVRVADEPPFDLCVVRCGESGRRRRASAGTGRREQHGVGGSWHATWPCSAASSCLLPADRSFTHYRKPQVRAGGRRRPLGRRCRYVRIRSPEHARRWPPPGAGRQSLRLPFRLFARWGLSSGSTGRGWRPPFGTAIYEPGRTLGRCAAVAAPRSFGSFSAAVNVSVVPGVEPGRPLS